MGGSGRSGAREARGPVEKAGKITGGRAGGWEVNAKSGFVQTFGMQGGGLGGGCLVNLQQASACGG